MTERVYFKSGAERIEFFKSEENKTKYVTGQTGPDILFAEKKTLTASQASGLGYGPGDIQRLRQKERISPQQDIPQMTGTAEQVKEALIKRYSAGEYDPRYSARVIEITPGRQRIEFYKTPGKQVSRIYYGIMDTRVARPDVTHSYEVDLSHIEQVADVKKWAKEHGAIAERVYASSKKEAKVLSDRGIVVRISSPKPLPDEINIRATKTIKEIRIKELSRVMAEKAYQKASPAEKITLHAQTLLSPHGYKYLGTAISPLDLGARKAIKETSLPKLEKVVTENLAEKISRQMQGKTTYDYDIPGIGLVKIPDVIVEAIHNPIIDIELMALGGAGMGKIATTKAGAKIIGSKAGKAALTVGAGAYAITEGQEIATLKALGREEEAIGKGFTLAAGLGAAVLGFKAQIAHVRAAAKTYEIDLSKVKGVSVTKEGKHQIVMSRGKFQVTQGKLKGLKGDTFSITRKGKGTLFTKVPEQKIGKIHIKPELTMRYTEQAKQIGKIHHRISSEARIGIGRAGKLIGKYKADTYAKEISRVMHIGTDKSGRQHNYIIKKLEGISIGKSARRYDVYLIRTVGGKTLLMEKSLLGHKGIAKIDWVDISKIGTPPTVIKGTPGPGIVTKATSVSKIVPAVAKITPAIPTQITIKAAETVKAVTGIPRIVMTVNPTPIGRVKVKHQPVPETVKLGAVKIVRRVSKGELKSISSGSLMQALTITQPRIERAWDKTKTKLSPAQSLITHPISGQIISSEEVLAVKSRLTPIIERIANQPIPVSPIKPIRTTIPKIPTMYIPFLRMPDISETAKGFEIGVIKNPVPKIEKVI